ncbi:MAG: hypothetical protein OEY79_02850 [Anaplasmataceae bacterium]|nr:hypothetical protein [Anaplasmataceae bacterium]
MQIVRLILLLFCFSVEAMTTEEFLKYCEDNNIKNCKVIQHVSGENIVNINNDFHSPCKEDETTCSIIEYRDNKTVVKQICKPGDADC